MKKIKSLRQNDLIAKRLNARIINKFVVLRKSKKKLKFELY